jgi:predicted dehydrogenase
MISLYHLRGWAETSGAQVVAVCDTDRERATQRAVELMEACYRKAGIEV